MRNGKDTRTGLFPFLLVDDDQAKVRIRVGFTKERSEEKSVGILRFLREEKIMDSGVSFEFTVVGVYRVHYFVP
jgi:hypothetical protein